MSELNEHQKELRNIRKELEFALNDAKNLQTAIHFAIARLEKIKDN